MKSIVISADDFGYSAGINNAILQLAGHSRIQAVSVLIGLYHPDWPELVNVDLGLHLNATFSPGLIEPERHLDRARWRQELSPAEVDLIRDEFRAQFDLFCTTFDRFPLHLGAHHGIHRNPQILDLLISLAKESNSFVRPYNDQMARALTANKLRHVDLSVLVEPKETATEASHLSSVLQVLEVCGPGTYELVCHPGFVDEQLRQRSSMVESRLVEFSLLDSLKMSSALHELGFKETRFSDL